MYPPNNRLRKFNCKKLKQIIISPRHELQIKLIKKKNNQLYSIETRLIQELEEITMHAYDPDKQVERNKHVLC